MCFFFNAAATTEFYTCSHTLSLHDALPIYQFGQFSPVVFAEQGSYLDLSLHSAIASRSAAVRAADEISESLFCRERSEEQTSELQSLMRITYAVFRLQKKTTLSLSHLKTNKTYKLIILLVSHLQITT